MGMLHARLALAPCLACCFPVSSIVLTSSSGVRTIEEKKKILSQGRVGKTTHLLSKAGFQQDTENSVLSAPTAGTFVEFKHVLW